MLLDSYGKSPEKEGAYTYFGYALVMFCMGFFMNLLVMLVTAQIKKVS